MNNKITTKKILKSAGAILVASTIFVGGVHIATNSTTTSTKQTTKLSPKQSVLSIANKYNVTELIQEDFVRFEVVNNQPIYVVVDENSKGVMTKENISAIKNSISDYNKLFEYINPNYKFEYISKKDFNKNSAPAIFITTNLVLNNNGNIENAKTTRPTKTPSKTNSGYADSNATIVLNSIAFYNYTIEQQQSIISHEIAHALGVVEHSADKSSIMNPYSTSSATSSEFSADVMYSLLSLYYNQNTNLLSLEEIEEYILLVSQKRNNDIFENDKDKFELSLFRYVQFKNISIINPNNLISKTYSYTNLYKQTLTITFNSDYTYSLTITRPNQTLVCNGVYEIKNNYLICSGENYTTKNKSLEKTNDKIYFSALSDNTCIFGCENNNFVLETILQNVETQEDLSY